MRRAVQHCFRRMKAVLNATRLSAGGVADEWLTQLLRQGDAKVFKKYSQMKLQMKREALQKLNRKANEGQSSFDTAKVMGFVTVLPRSGRFSADLGCRALSEFLEVV